MSFVRSIRYLYCCTTKLYDPEWNAIRVVYTVQVDEGISSRYKRGITTLSVWLQALSALLSTCVGLGLTRLDLHFVNAMPGVDMQRVDKVVQYLHFIFYTRC